MTMDQTFEQLVYEMAWKLRLLQEEEPINRSNRVLDWCAEPPSPGFDPRPNQTSWSPIGSRRSSNPSAFNEEWPVDSRYDRNFGQRPSMWLDGNRWDPNFRQTESTAIRQPSQTQSSYQTNWPPTRYQQHPACYQQQRSSDSGSDSGIGQTSPGANSFASEFDQFDSMNSWSNARQTSNPWFVHGWSGTAAVDQDVWRGTVQQPDPWAPMRADRNGWAMTDETEYDIEDPRAWEGVFDNKKRKIGEWYICHRCGGKDHHVKECPKVYPEGIEVTGYQGSKPCVGWFYCDKCKRKWLSHNSKSNTAEKCKKCKADIFPKKQYAPEVAANLNISEKFRKPQQANAEAPFNFYGQQPTRSSGYQKWAS